MRLDLAGAFGVAVLVHAAAFGLAPRETGLEAAGAGGQDLVSLEAQNLAIAAMVAEWERPAEQVRAKAVPQAANAALSALARPAQTVPGAPADTRRLASVQPQPPSTPGVSIAPVSRVQSLSSVAAARADSAVESAATKPTVPQKQTISATAPREAIEGQAPPPVGSAIAPVASLRPPPMPVRPDRAENTPNRAPQAARAGGQRQSARSTAAGRGGGSASGSSQKASAPSQSATKTKSLRRQWAGAIVARVERGKRYPNAARGASGRAVVTVTVAQNGRLSGIRLTQSSGVKAIDQAAVQAVRRAGRFPRAPQGLAGPITFDIGLRFSR